MLTLSLLKENKDLVISGLKKKYVADPEGQVDHILAVDGQRRSVQFELDGILADSNQKAKLIGELMKTGKKEEAEKLKAEAAAARDTSKTLQDKLNELEKEVQALLVKLPNLPHHSVPEGRTPEENIVVLEKGDKPSLTDKALPHWDLIKKLDIIDFELGNKITGAGFPVYKNKGARLQRAMINFFLDEAVKAGYTEVQVPIFVNEDSAYGTGQLPDKDGQMYHATADNLYVIPTAEVPITNIYRDVILKAEELPVKNVGYTPCFRREAGSWGADVRGLNRLHQFDKVEIVQVAAPEHSYNVLVEMRNHIQGLLEKLELPFRILHLCGGDMSFTSALTYDFEVYSAAQKKWLEVSSVSNFESYQANRLKLRFKVDGKTQLLHTLNGSALALPRVLAAIIENNQTENGINIPKALQAYTGFATIEA
ncbi:MAG: serine--tRNA ligase [Cytophagaceae bacterium]